jgi:hypothetical protein
MAMLFSERSLSDVQGEVRRLDMERWQAGNRRMSKLLTSLSNLARTGVFVVENGNKEDWIAAGVRLVVADRPLREKDTLTFCQGVFDETSTILSNKARFHLSVHEVEDLGRSGVGMRGVYAAWPNSGS